MQTLESLKSQGQAGLSNLWESAKEQPDDVKRWGVTAGGAIVGALAVNAAARGAIALLATLTAPPIALTVGAIGGGYLGWNYIRTLQAEEEAAAFDAEPIAETITVVTPEKTIIPEESATPAAPSAPMASPKVQDDLKKINGIGPVYEGRLQAAGIQTYAQLAELSTEQIRQIIGTERSGHMIEPDAWITEAGQLAKATQEV